MIAREGHSGKLWWLPLALFASALGLPARSAVGQGLPPSAQSPRAEIVLIGDGDAIVRVKDVTAELLARDRIEVTWSAQDSFRPQDIFDRRAGDDAPASPDGPHRGSSKEPTREGGVAVWIDLSAPAEARLYFRDSRAERFFIRSLPLAQGIDEIAKEEIAHVVTNAVVALGRGRGEALTRSEARTALHMESVQQPQRGAGARSSPPLRFEVAALAGGQVFASDIPFAPAVTVSLALTRGPRWGRTEGALGAWMDLGYQFATHYQGATVGAAVQTAFLRAGMMWRIEGPGALGWRFGLGAGADRIHYQPQGDSALVDLAPASSFYVPVIRLLAGLDLRLIDSLVLTAQVSADAALTEIHFDLRDSGGRLSRELVPYPVRPGVSLGIAFLF